MWAFAVNTFPRFTQNVTAHPQSMVHRSKFDWLLWECAALGENIHIPPTEPTRNSGGEKSAKNPLPEIGDILRPRSIWHAVSNYQDGGIKKAVRRKNKDWNDTLSKDLNQFNFVFEVVNTRENEKGETRVRAPVRMTILERKNNFVSCVTWKSKNNFQKSGPTVHLASEILFYNNHIWSTYL